MATLTDIFMVASWIFVFAIIITSLYLCFRKDFNEDLEIGLPNYLAAHHAMQRQASKNEASRPSTIGIVVEYKDEEGTEPDCTDCAICLERFKDGDSCKVLPKCKHQYHRFCIDQWLVKNTHCPLCRDSVAVTVCD